MFVLIYPNQINSVKRFNVKKYYLLKGIIKNYNLIINEENFYDQTIDFGIKQYDEIRKLTTEQGENYTSG